MHSYVTVFQVTAFRSTHLRMYTPLLRLQSPPPVNPSMILLTQVVNLYSSILYTSPRTVLFAFTAGVKYQGQKFGTNGAYRNHTLSPSTTRLADPHL